MEDFISTRGSSGKLHANFVTVQYQAPKKKLKKEEEKINTDKVQKTVGQRSEKNNQNGDVDARRAQELEMKRARYEVMKFGMSGFEKAKAKQAKVALAVSLGAKPPKNRRVNYKKLMTQRKKEKEEAEREKHVSGLDKSMLKYKVKNTRKKVSDSILGAYGKVQKLNGRKK